MILLKKRTIKTMLKFNFKLLLINYKDLILLSINSILIVLLLIIISTILYYTNIDTIIYNYIYNIL